MINKMSFTLICMVFFSVCLVGSSKSMVVKKNGKREIFDKVSAKDNGDLIVTKGKIKTKINKSAYLYVVTPKTTSLKKASELLKKGDNAKAAAAFAKLYKKYKYLGWGAYCLYYAGYAYEKAGDKSQAASQLKKLDRKPFNPKAQIYYYGAKKILGKIYLDNKEYTNLEGIVKDLYDSKRGDFAAYANNLMGDVYMQQGKVKDAKLMYMRTALLYDSSNRKDRPEALVKIIKILKSERNIKSQEFVKILEKDYPGTAYLKQI